MWEFSSINSCHFHLVIGPEASLPCKSTSCGGAACWWSNLTGLSRQSKCASVCSEPHVQLVNRCSLVPPVPHGKVLRWKLMKKIKWMKFLLKFITNLNCVVICKLLKNITKHQSVLSPHSSTQIWYSQYLSKHDLRCLGIPCIRGYDVLSHSPRCHESHMSSHW